MGTSIFYVDQTLKRLEAVFAWDKAIKYLEEEFIKRPCCSILNTIIGISWFAVVEGPYYKSRFGIEESDLAIICWKKYVNIGIEKYYNDPYFCYICGYTLALDGFMLDATEDNYEQKGITFMNKCAQLSKSISLSKLAENFLLNIKSKKHVPLKKGEEICRELFDNETLLGKYFIEFFS